jgi:hypothetical protein
MGCRRELRAFRRWRNPEAGHRSIAAPRRIVPGDPKSLRFITEAVGVRAILESIGEPAILPRIVQARRPASWYEDATEDTIDAEACPAGDPYAQPAPEYEHDHRVC